MDIGRKIYYDKATGNVIIDTGERSGDVSETTVEQDFACYVALSERVPETVGVIQLNHSQYAQDFAECNGYRVNPATQMLEFSYPDPGLPAEQPTVYRQSLGEEVKQLKNEIQATQDAVDFLLLSQMPQI